MCERAGRPPCRRSGNPLFRKVRITDFSQVINKICPSYQMILNMKPNMGVQSKPNAQVLKPLCRRIKLVLKSILKSQFWELRSVTSIRSLPPLLTRCTGYPGSVAAAFMSNDCGHAALRSPQSLLRVSMSTVKKATPPQQRRNHLKQNQTAQFHSMLHI